MDQRIWLLFVLIILVLDVIASGQRKSNDVEKMSGSDHLMLAGVSNSCTIDVVMKKLWPDQAQDSQTAKVPVSKEQFQALEDEVKRRLAESVFEVDANLWDDRTGAGPEIKLSIKKPDKHDLRLFHHFAFPIGRGMAKACERRVTQSIDLIFTPEPEKRRFQASVRITFKKGKERAEDKLVVRWNTKKPESHFDVTAIQWDWTSEIWKFNDPRFQFDSFLAQQT